MAELTEDHLQVRATARQFAEEVVKPTAAARDESCEFPMDSIRQMGELGFLGLPYGEEYGGAGMDALAYVIAVEEIARVCGSTAITFAAHTSLGCGPIHDFGTEAQRKKYLPKLLSGQSLACFGLTEPNAGSDAGGTQTFARPADGGWVVNGNKIYITNGTYADVCVFTARVNRDAGTRGICAFIVEKGAKGYRVGKKENKMGLRGSDTVELIFEDCFIPRENLLGNEGEGFKQFLKTLAGGRISIGALALGIAQGAFEAAVKYSRERKQFDKPICEFEGIQFMLADMATRIEAARHLVYDAARRKSAGLPFNKQSAMAKLFASETGTWCADRSIQIHGGIGYMRDLPVERMLRDAKLMEIGEGTSEIQRVVISREVLKEL
ncbi:MAG: acyl-CoA dehydrogenase family protein [Candidatus Eisenbacteria bacterium]|nr:acyl-CoA dehydrogenase family protein [Candidatus Eisenbacteria bacterium]